MEVSKVFQMSFNSVRVQSIAVFCEADCYILQSIYTTVHEKPCHNVCLYVLFWETVSSNCVRILCYILLFLVLLTEQIWNIMITVVWYVTPRCVVDRVTLKLKGAGFFKTLVLMHQYMVSQCIFVTFIIRHIKSINIAQKKEQ